MARVRIIYERTCPICGRVFMTYRQRKKYCDVPCYERAKKHRWYLRKKQQRRSNLC